MTDSIKLPPLPERAWPEIKSAMREYARAAVALNAPGWHRTADDPPPDTDDWVVCYYQNVHLVDTAIACVVRQEPECYPFWMFAPELPAGPEAA